MHKSARENKMWKVGKTNKNNLPDAKKTRLGDVQQIVETSENFQIHDFVTRNRKNSTNQLDRKSLEKLKNVANESKYLVLYVSFILNLLY